MSTQISVMLIATGTGSISLPVLSRALTAAGLPGHPEDEGLPYDSWRDFIAQVMPHLMIRRGENTREQFLINPAVYGPQ